MTDQQIIDNNKLIAEFMEAKPNLYTLRKDGSRNYFYGIHVGNIYEKAIKPKGMPFYTDWNWLMPVVDKINTIVDKNNYGYGIGIRYNQIKPAYKAVVEFIEWYNKEGK